MIIKVADTIFNIINGGKELQKIILPFSSSGIPEHEITILEDDFNKQRGELAVGISNYLVSKKNTLRVHASCISYKDNAIMFLAPSGTGKSTHAYLWHKIAGAEYINDDQPYLNMDNMQVYGFCVAGKHNRFSLKISPLHSLVFISQSKTNNIKKLSKQEAVKLLYSQMLQYLNLDSRKKILECMDILSNMPVYLLECDISKEAFLTCYKGVFGKDYEN